MIKCHRMAIALIASMMLLSACAGNSSNYDPNSPLSADEQTIMHDLKTDFTSGNYHDLIDKVDDAPETYEGSLPFRSQALKYKAMSQCALSNIEGCSNTIRQLLENNPNFELDVSEQNHPVWGAIFRQTKDKVLRERRLTGTKKYIYKPQS